MPVPGTICSVIPPTFEATTAFAFHMPSATVSPKPFLQALLHNHGGMPLDGVHHRRVLVDIRHGQGDHVTRRRASAGSSSQAARHSAYTSAPSGSSVTPTTAGPTNAR